MTHNQIEFQELKETIRHNQKVESETGRHNVVTEDQGWSSIQETKRHNLVNEALGYGNLALGYDTLSETKRHNIVGETETHRHNVVTEDQGWKHLDLEGRRVAVAERGQSLNEWQAQFLPTDVETRRIQAKAATASASAALQQAGVASALLPYNAANLSARSEEAYKHAALYSSQNVTEVYRQENISADTQTKRAEKDKLESEKANIDARTYHQEWLNQDANLFIEQGQNITGVTGNVISSGNKAKQFQNSGGK